MLRIFSPPLGEIHSRIVLFITMVLGQVFDVEDVANVVLVAWDVDLVGVVIVVCDHLEWSVGSWEYLGLAFLGEAVFAEMYPYLITRLEHHRRLVDVELGGESLYLALDRGTCFFMHLLEVGSSCTSVQVCSFMKR